MTPVRICWHFKRCFWPALNTRRRRERGSRERRGGDSGDAQRRPKYLDAIVAKTVIVKLANLRSLSVARRDDEQNEPRIDDEHDCEHQRQFSQIPSRSPKRIRHSRKSSKGEVRTQGVSTFFVISNVRFSLTRVPTIERSS